MDKSWMELPNRFSNEYRDGVRKFIDFAYANTEKNGKIKCPCLKCNNFYWQTGDNVKCHLLVYGIVRSYNPWVQHGESSESSNQDDYEVEVNDEEEDREESEQDDMEGMLHDLYFGDDGDGVPRDECTREGPQVTEGEGEKFAKLVKDAQQELYPGCTKSSKLSFIVKLMHLKSMNRWSEKSFNMLLDLFKEVLPNGSNIPTSFYEAKKVIQELGLKYDKIDVCRNDCALFWGCNENRNTCPTCGEGRWKTRKDNGRKIPYKVLRYFPIKPRLQRLFINKSLASDMRWHKDKRVAEDNILRHPADGEAWKEFDRIHETFSSDPRNVRLGLSSDGFNPFSNMSSSYSAWPVVLVPYNLPPWKSMKEPFIMLSLLIPGPKSPGNDIDVFLQPLIKDLKELWEVGVQTYDALTESTFQLRAAVMWTINDFPAYADLSGWSTKGKLACPVCNKETSSIYLKKCHKVCFMGHRRFLPIKHKWRRDASSFDGNKESRQRPEMLSGDDVLTQINRIRPVIFGKKDGLGKRKREKYELNWTKRSIFFDLPYWKTLKLRHNLDVMHIEKNVSESILGTLMNIDGKTKDTLNSRLDLENLNIRPELHPYESGDKWVIPPACYTLSYSEKKALCEFWHSLKLPDGYASNISRCINVKECRISGLKSHDYHVFLQQLLPLAIRGYLRREVCQPLIELSSFFKELCSKNLRVDVLEKLESNLAVTLCKLERIFPPSFFDVMVHLPIHLAREAILGGPVQYRWMYFIERYLHTLKLSVTNKARPEGSIAECYVHNECLTFCSLYLSGVETKFNKPQRNYDGHDSRKGISVFSYNGLVLGKADCQRLAPIEWRKARLYVLDNCEEIQEYVKEHNELLKLEGHIELEKLHAERFPRWFEERVTKLEHQSPGCVSKQLRALSWGPDRRVRHYKSCLVNGYRFHTRDLDEHRTTQNSGVVVVGEHANDNIDFYGQLYDIVELEYADENRVVLFKCEWWELGKKKGAYGKRVDEYGYVSVNASKTWYNDQPFVLSYQAEQVFYAVDTKLGKEWIVPVNNTPRDRFNYPKTPMEESIDEDDPYQQLEQTVVEEVIDIDDENQPWRRDDIPSIEIDACEKQVVEGDNDLNENDVMSDSEDEEKFLHYDDNDDDYDDDDCDDDLYT